MKKIITVFMTLVLIASLCACGTKDNEENVIKIGVIAEISGDAAVAGKYVVNGAKLLESEIAAEGGLTINGTTYKIEFVYEDNESKEDVTVNAMQKLINQENVIAVIGPASSKRSLVSFPIAQQAGVVAITSYGTNEAVTQIGDYCFRACFIDSFQGYAAAKHMKDEGYKKVAILFNNADAYSVGLKDAFIENFTGEVVAIESYSGSDTTDFNVQLAKIAAEKPDALFFPNLYLELPLQIQQARNANLTCPIVTGDSADNPEILALAGLDNLKGVRYISAFAGDSTDEYTAKFAKAYKEMFGEEANGDAVLIYEAGMMVIEGLKTAKKIDRASLRDAIANIKDLKVPTGVITVGEDRNPIKGAVVMEYDGEGQRHFLTVVNP